MIETDELYSKELYTNNELRDLGKRAIEKLIENPYGRKLHNLLQAVTLAQGAALHQAVQWDYASRYLNTNEAGIKDIDIWMFFEAKNEKVFNPRWKKHFDFGKSRFGRNPQDPPEYIGRRIDLFGRSIEIKKNESVEDSILRWLQKPGRGSPFHLKQKAIIGLFPESTLGEVIWINPYLT
jgi:hypothetical protein